MTKILKMIYLKEFLLPYSTERGAYQITRNYNRTCSHLYKIEVGVMRNGEFDVPWSMKYTHEFAGSIKVAKKKGERMMLYMMGGVRAGKISLRNWNAPIF